MKKFLGIVLVISLVSCNPGNTGTDSPGDSSSVKFDTVPNSDMGIMNTDTAGATIMKADTSGMGQAK
jgi:hypothetical protein